MLCHGVSVYQVNIGSKALYHGNQFIGSIGFMFGIPFREDEQRAGSEESRNTNKCH